ncbi:Ribonuclease BN [Paenibacillus auburnensis]|uniref:Ribonuclease BN n=1 Tax=Paenibacillus auburnensis TaxID=2905649 RepID=A0ABM9BMK4_9BACL|nr:MBL fold metallo-hydrolase [Paenibacillus auburnensis]CAH1190693.1 Ribonuclease BN [Paenibacillus auburnensis]
MTVNLQMLGTGDAFAKNYYNNNGLLLSRDYTLLIDCGTTAPRAMEKLGRSFADVNAVLITHIHDDHVGGLPELSRLMKTKFGRKMILLIADTLAEPLWESFQKNSPVTAHNPSSLEDAFEVRLLKPGSPHKLSTEIILELIRTPHIRGKESYSLLLGGDIFYSADMIFQPELLLKLVRKQGIRQIFHDCQLKGPGEVHTTLSELLSLPEDVRKMIRLMHYGDHKPQFEGKTAEMTFLEQHVIYAL